MVPAAVAARDDQGASAVEYSLLVAAVATVLVTVAFAIGLFSRSTYDSTCTNLADHITTDEATNCP
ncbi:MAG: Flp family type IVb pilin [Sporichthyaceae bacterium]|nr:Flp family type IVb pilin [Sporichthyaceae bacterium]